MKKVYIIIVMFSASAIFYAQENKAKEEIQAVPETNTEFNKPKESKYVKKDDKQLASEYGLDTSQKNVNKAASAGGKVYNGSGSEIEFIRSTMPGNKPHPNTNAKNKKAVKGLPNTATLQEIKATIPKK